jgi:putative hydrolase of the HAD superfamily
LVDYGNVLCRPQRAEKVQAMAARLNVSVAAFMQAYRSRRDAYDSGQAPQEYWRLVVRSLEREALWSEPLLTSLIDDDSESWSDYHEEVWAIVQRFRARGGLAAFLSNNVPPLMARLRAERRLEQVFDVVVASCELGVAKPQDGIFLHCLQRLGIAPEQGLFVDDHPPNIDAAARLGIGTFLFQGNDAAAKLRELVE